jgi:hypothetical protein
MPRRLAVPLFDWPDADRRAWAAALETGDTFADGGIAARWRPTTWADALNGYAYWIKFLVDQDPALLDLEPGARATPDLLHAYLKTLLLRMSAMGAAATLGHLALALRAIAPTCELTELRAIQYSTQRRASPRNKRTKLVSSERLVNLGSELMAGSEWDGEVHDLRAKAAARQQRLASCGHERPSTEVPPPRPHCAFARAQSPGSRPRRTMLRQEPDVHWAVVQREP